MVQPKAVNIKYIAGIVLGAKLFSVPVRTDSEALTHSIRDVTIFIFDQFSFEQKDFRYRKHFCSFLVHILPRRAFTLIVAFLSKRIL